MKLKTGIRLAGAASEYPVMGMLVVMGLILLSPFLSAYLCYAAFLVCIYRMLRYDARVFATDYCMMIPVSQVFRTSGSMSLLIWLCLVAAIWYFVRGKIRVNGALVCMIVLLNYFIARMQMNINDFVLCFGQMFVLYVLLPKQDAESAERATKVFCWSLLITSVYALLLRDAPQIVAIRGPEDPAIWGTTIMRFSGLIKDPNYYMTLLIVGLAALCKLKETNRIQSIWFWVLALVLTAFGVLTYSKTFFLVFILLGGVYIIWQFWSRKIVKGVFFTTVTVIAASYLLLAESSPFAVVIERLTSSDSLSVLTTGRTDVYIAYMDAIFDNAATALFGLGLGAEALAKDPHNIYLEIAYYVGMLGLVLILSLLVAVFRDILSKDREIREQNVISKYILIAMVGASYFTLHGMFQILFYAEMFLALMSIKLVNKK